MTEKNIKKSVTVFGSKKMLWAGRIVSAIAVLFLLMDGVMKVMQLTPVMESFEKLGYPTNVALSLGILQLVCVICYVIPRTSILGAILLTGYLGGAVATHVRVGDPLFSHVLFPVYLGILVWGGIWFRNERLRSVIPLQK